MPFALRVLDRNWHPRAPRSADFGCTDLSLKPQTALQIYAPRWGCQTDNVYLKTRLGLGDFRLRPDEAADKYLAPLPLALAYLPERRRHERAPRLRNLADVIRHHRDEHPRDWLTDAGQEAMATGDLAAVLNRFLRLDD